jgi:hypothetical protein
MNRTNLAAVTAQEYQTHRDVLHTPPISSQTTRNQIYAHSLSSHFAPSDAYQVGRDILYQPPLSDTAARNARIDALVSEAAAR